MPAASATPIVEELTVVSPESADSPTANPVGSRSKRSRRSVSSSAVTHVVPSPSKSVASACEARRQRRLMRPTHAAVIGSRSGLTAIAPTIRMPLDPDHAKAGDHAGRGHEHEKACDRASVGPGLPDDVGQDQAGGRAPDGCQLIEARERDALPLHPATHEELKHGVGRVLLHLRGQQGVALTHGLRDHDLPCHAAVLEASADLGQRGRCAVHP